MPGFEETKAVLHPVRVKLYPNYLTDEGKYVARTDAYGSLSIEDICGNLRERGSFTGNPEDAANNIKQFCEECGFLICDGFSLNLRHYSISPHVNGTWNDRDEANDRAKHPIGFTFRTLKPLRELAARIKLEVTDVNEETAYIDHVTDVSSGTVDETLTESGMIVIEGHRIKLAGTTLGLGVYISGHRTDGTPYSVRILPPFAENSSSKIIAKLPANAPPEGTYQIDIVTQFSGGSSLLKHPRTISTAAIFVVGPPPASDEAPAAVAQ